MKYLLRFAAVAGLICDLLLFTANISAQQNKDSPSSQGLYGGAIGMPWCGSSNPPPSPCASTRMPRVLSETSPTYSERARRAKIEGTCIVGLVVDEKGTPTNPRIVKGLGMGLDEKAIEAVKKWKFEPALKFDPVLKDAKPVPAEVAVEVDFHF